ncbi:MAG: winged helix-turn-helix domain-containing protein [Colwellia sp.]|nr:winged helix-turn-helix domain-containing protein [Colwellia sp.]
MHYIFRNFEFDSTSLLLTKNGEIVTIRHNEAKVLSLLLEQADKVLSKEDILANVWQDKVVSEQAVFQNMSHLRNLFGNDAIKTFPKRGYQWQLEIKRISEKPQQSINIVETSKQSSQFVTIKNGFRWQHIVLLGCILFVMFVLTMQTNSSKKNTNDIIKLAYIPFSNNQELADITFDDNALFDFTALTQLNTTHFKDTIEISYPKLKSNHPFVLTGNIRTYKHKVYLDFLLKGPYGDWSGQLSALSKTDIINKLQGHLKQTFIYDILSKPQAPQLKQANLSIAHQQTPTDLINLGELVKSYIAIEELEKAMVMADKLASIASLQSNALQIGNALLLQSEILTRKELYDLSSHKLTLAIEQFKEIEDLGNQADAWFAQSWLDHQQDDYAAIKIHLLKSADLAFEIQDKERELDVLTYLSVMAHKHHQEIDQYLYLQQAENKMKSYQLPIYHFARIPFHYAIFAKKALDKEPHFKQVLEFTALTPDNWVAQSSRLSLMKYYINQKRLEEAQVLLNNLKTENTQNLYLKTLLAKAKKQTDVFNRLAQRTFEQAQLSGNKSISLDVALLLCSDPNIQVNYDFYSQYIHENASKYWRRDNEVKLLALNL